MSPMNGRRSKSGMQWVVKRERPVTYQVFILSCIRPFVTPWTVACQTPLSPLSCGKVKVTQLCPTICIPMDYTVHGILQARILEGVAFPSSRGSSQPRDWTRVSCVSCIAAESYLLSHLGSQLLMAIITFIFLVEDDYNFLKNWHS